MASRYPGPRDRSPQRPFDRRPSGTYVSSASTYRGTGDPQVSSDRPPPRGPKADFRGGGYSFGPAPRGRGGYAPRAGDTWDRDRERDRDARNPPPAYRREDERTDWPRRDREFAPSDRGVGFARDRGYVGRDRSASPERPRRNSKEGISPAFGRPAESTSLYYSPATRGASVRGRGRGDWERSRGRSSFVSEREREFFPRSRSREDWRERDYDRGRPSGTDGDRSERFERRDYDRLDDRDRGARDHDVWPRDRSPGRNSTGRPASPSALSTISQHGERYKVEHDVGRKLSMAGPLSARSEGRREADSDYDIRFDHFPSRVETPRRDGPLSQPFPAPSIPPSASLGLDYGPPPSVPATTPAVQEKPPPATTKPQPVKTDAPAAPLAPSTNPGQSNTVSSATHTVLSAPTASALSATSAAPTAPAATATATAPVMLQPPSGPKAARVGPPPNAPSTPRAANQQFEQWPKTDSASRPLRLGPSIGTPSSAHDSSWKMSDPPAENRTPTAAAVDRPLPANVPSGPRAASGGFRGRLLSNEQAAPNAPPTAPRQPKAIALENRAIPNAPTGPRASTFTSPNMSHNVPPTGPQAGTNRHWVAPEYRPQKPSIMNQLNKPYQPDMRERSSLSGASARPGGVTYQSQQAKPKITQPLSGEAASQLSPTKAIGLQADVPSGTQTPMDEDMLDSPANVEVSLPASDEEDVEDDDGLDEDYFAASEETHVREMKLLESKKPLPPLQDPVTASLIIRIHLLGMIANDVIPEAYESIKTRLESAMELDVPPSDAPLSPEDTPEESARPTLEHPKPRGRPLSQPVVNPIPTPPIDELPYLNDALEGCHVFEEVENEVQRESYTMLLCQSFEHDAWEEMDKIEDLHAFYKRNYPPWRKEVEYAEQRLREVHQPSPAPASPAPSATPSLPTAADRLGIERTRGARNTTDLDMQQAILMSQQSAKEEEERREREAASNAMPNYETEAVVPVMILPSEVGNSHFEDMNAKVELELALDIYEFIPPEDDFTEEEQAAFITAYCQTPKKWGKIADSIAGRTYQDCIMHYYLTKDKANYKEHWRRSQPKRGRRRAANVKPRANNLMSDLALNEEGEGTPVAVTDSGRPRRAAAPTFGDMPDSDAASTGPQAKRLKEGVKETDPTQPKPRGRKGTGTGKGRKAKDKVVIDHIGQPLLPAGNVDTTAQKFDRGISSKEKVGRSSLKTETNHPKLESHGATPMTTQIPVDVNKLVAGETFPSSIGPVPQVTSYWSVPEVQKFPDLVQYFGRNYAEIAAFLKTKSPIMIKNYYQRELSSGKTELEMYADLADQKRARGEPMGPPPTPVQPPKRRYEATPSMASISRTTVGMIDHHIPDIDPNAPMAKTIIEEFPANSIQRIDGEPVAKPRPPKENVHQVFPKVEEPSRVNQPSLLQKPAGPPRGKFQDELPYNPQHLKPQPPTQDVSPRQRSLQMVDHRPVEVRPPQSQQSESRATDFNRSLLPHREQVVQPQQTSMVQQQYPPPAERQLHQASRLTHSRHPSHATGQSVHEQTAASEPTSMWAMDVARNMAYSSAAAHSPIPVPVQAINTHSTETYPANRSLSQRVEPPKPVTAKRSNVFSILNDDPPDPPAKKQSVEGVRPGSINTPPPQQLPPQSSLMSSRQQDDSLRHQQSYSRTAHMDSIRMDSMRSDYRQHYSPSPALGRPSESWALDRFDPRQQSQGSEQRPSQPSPVPGSYSIIPPSSQSTPVTSASARYDPARNSDRRSLIGMSLAPASPPPQQLQPQQQQQQQQQQSSHPHRTSSGSSQHGRGPSMAYQQSSNSGGLNYPHSASSTPVSALHSRSQTSIDSQHRQKTIQQFMRDQEKGKQDEGMQHHHQQQQQQQPPPQVSQAPRPQQPPSQPPSRMSDRRDIYGQVPESRPPQHHVAPPTSQTPQPQSMSMAYATAPPRTYTPPHPGYGSSSGIGGHSHGHHAHQQQYQPQYQQHNTSQGPSQHHPAYQNHHQGYNPAPQSQPQSHSRSGHPLGGPHQSQQAHYRGYSTDERR